MGKPTLRNLLKLIFIVVFFAATNLCIVECFASEVDHHHGHCVGHSEQSVSHHDHHSSSKSSDSDEADCCKSLHIYPIASSLKFNKKQMVFQVLSLITPLAGRSLVPAPRLVGRPTGADPPERLVRKFFSSLSSAPNAPPFSVP